MNPPFRVEYSKTAAKYLESLDAPTKARIKQKIAEVSGDPRNPRHSKPLYATEKRSARVGTYRIILVLTEEVVVIADIDSRGAVYKRL